MSNATNRSRISIKVTFLSSIVFIMSSCILKTIVLCTVKLFIYRIVSRECTDCGQNNGKPKTYIFI